MLVNRQAGFNKYAVKHAGLATDHFATSPLCCTLKSCAAIAMMLSTPGGLSSRYASNVGSERDDQPSALQINTNESSVRRHHGMSRLASFGDTSLYGVYATAHEQVFDSDETIPKVDYHINPDVAINNAVSLLRLAVADRKVLLESRVDLLPASIRLDKSLDEYDSFDVERTKELVDNIISGKYVSASKAAEADLENIMSNVYIDQFAEASERVCRLSEKLLCPLKIERPKVEVVASSPTRVITRTVSMLPKQHAAVSLSPKKAAGTAAANFAAPSTVPAPATLAVAEKSDTATESSVPLLTVPQPVPVIVHNSDTTTETSAPVEEVAVEWNEDEGVAGADEVLSLLDSSAALDS